LGNAAAGPFISQRIAGLLAKINAEDLEYLAALFDAGYLKPVIDRTFPLAETAAAIRYVEQCHARGKVVVSVP
jgi:NADPH:quinone reductase-like Zn-dependent oxidoreductase